jgi:hypothetical protein
MSVDIVRQFLSVCSATIANPGRGGKKEKPPPAICLRWFSFFGSVYRISGLQQFWSRTAALPQFLQK